MLNLPKSTEFNKRIPKQKFYDKLNVTSAIKQIFVEQIKTIFWKNKIAPTTTNLSEGKSVTEIEVFEIKLNAQSLDESVLKLIDKEESDGNTAFKINSYYHTKWSESPEIEIRGLDMDKVYESFVRQIAGDTLTNGENESLQEKENLKKQIELNKQLEEL